MRTYAEHYNECRNRANFTSSVKSPYSSVYDLSLDTDFLSVDDEYHRVVEQVSKKITHKININEGCYHRKFATYLNDWRDITELSDLANIIIPQIEQKVFHSHAQIEFLMPYRNLTFTEEPLASWLWHYDDCPREFIKFALYLNDTTEDNGCMQYMSDPDGRVPIMNTYRLSPHQATRKQVFPGSRIPSDFIETLDQSNIKPRNLVGPRGTYALFTPNVIHRATIPKPEATPREAIFFFVRPSLEKSSSYINGRVHSVLPERNVKQYELV